MTKIKGKLTKKEELEVSILLQELNDVYGDFYITRNNLRLYIKENVHLLFECLNKGDKIVYNEENGIILATGWSDKSDRIYVKILTKNIQLAEKLIRNLVWNIQCDLYIKLKKNNPLIENFKKNGFKFLGSRGRELLMKRTYIPIQITKDKEEKENDR